MDSDSILSREEIDALLSAIRDPEETAAPAVQAWDFSKPRRLLASDLARIRDRCEPHLLAIAQICKQGLNAPVQVRLLEPAESTFAELLEDRPVGSLAARAGDALIDPSSPVAFALLERAMGGGRLTRPPDRPLRDLEAQLVTPVLEAILEALSLASPPLRWAPAAQLAGEAWPEGTCVLLGLEILSEGLLGDILIALPVAQFEVAPSRPAAEPHSGQGVDIEIAARFPLATLRLGDLRSLAPGDLLVWSGDSAPPVTVEVSRRPQYSGRPGTMRGKAAVEILKAAGSEGSASSLVRVSGGRPSTGAPEVPVEVRAVLADRMLSLRDLGTLRPGALLEFTRSAEAAVELRLGRWRVARGAVVRAGDRLAVKVESLDSAPRNL